MGHKLEEFINLVNEALRVAESDLLELHRIDGAEAQVRWLRNIIKALMQMKEDAAHGRLEPSRGIVTTGLLREVLDVGQCSSSQLVDTASAVESYYLHQLKSSDDFVR
ncbi:MAG: hypothetical protein QOF61_1987 [Acidobacteriota bacterium]|nr:hypothetical protein [Acidobacteriota bacterium]